MIDNKFGMSFSEISEIRPMNPETAAHNIALAYIQSAFRSSELPADGYIAQDSIFPIANVYVDAYNFAYNFIAHENKLIDEAE